MSSSPRIPEWFPIIMAPVSMRGVHDYNPSFGNFKLIEWKDWTWRTFDSKSPMDCKETQPVHSKGDQSWVFFGRDDTKAETPVLCHLMWRVDSLEKTDAGRDWRQEEKGTTEDEMDGWHHQLNGPGFGWSLGVGDGQGGLASCNSWGRKESDTTEQLNLTELNWTMFAFNWLL